jgi:hypothetical protein
VTLEGKCFCTKPGGNEDGRSGRPNLRRCEELGEEAGCRTLGLMCREGRGGGGTLRREVTAGGCSTIVRRRRKRKKKEGGGRRKKNKKKEEKEGK